MKVILKMFFAMTTLTLIFVACEDEDVSNPYPIRSLPVLEFETRQGTIQETDSSKTLTILFSKPASGGGSIRLTFDAAFAKFFLTDPVASEGKIEMAVKKNDTKASFKVFPVNDNKNDGERLIRFNVREVAGDFKIGEEKVYALTIKDDDQALPMRDSYINFIERNLNLQENESTWHEIQMQVSEPGSANGNVIVESVSEKAHYGIHYITEPAFSNNQLTLMASGEPVLKFKIKALDNSFISGHTSLHFKIRETSGNLKKGIALEDSVNISDDELAGMFKGYEVGGGTWSQKRFYEYNESGKISNVRIESYTPYYGADLHTYYYNDNDQLFRINTDPGQDLLYTYASGKIAMEQRVDNGIIDRYTEFDYDHAGNVSGYQTFYLQPDGNFKLTNITVLLYYTDGNLYKKLVYSPSAANPEDPYLISTETFDGYIDKANPSPMVQVLPYFKTQKNLPSIYRLETNGHSLSYNFSYEYREDGKVTKRKTSGASTETAVYRYY